MSDAMSEAPISHKHTINLKKTRRFSGILKCLAKSDRLIPKIKVTVSEGEIFEDKEQFFIAPSKFKNTFENIAKRNSIVDKNENLSENLNIETQVSSQNDIEVVDYPDSSDFSEDE